MVTKLRLLGKNAIKGITQAAAKAKEEMESYKEDMEMYSKPEFWEAIKETAEHKGKRFKSAKKMFAELDKD